MHIIGILTAIATLIYWVMRAVGSTRDSGVISDWKRKKRWDYSGVNSKSELDELWTPLDAAATMMIALGRDDISGELTPKTQREIQQHLIGGLGADEDEVTETVERVAKILKNTADADTVVLPVCRILK